MLCEICHQGLKGIWDPFKAKRLGTFDNFLGPDDEVQIEPIPEPSETLDPEKIIFGHHADFKSFEKSILQGCVMCSRFRPRERDIGRNRKIESVGYFSIFRVFLTSSSDQPAMLVHFGNTLGTFNLTPYQGSYFPLLSILVLRIQL